MRTIYTDWSCLWNPGPWGWAGVIQWGEQREIVLSWWAKETTNNAMELTAAVKTLQWLFETYTSQKRVWTDVTWLFASWATPSRPYIGVPVTLITDSNYLKLGITEWMVTRKRRQRRRAKWGKLVENMFLRQELDVLVSCFTDLSRQRTKAHVGTELNERVDALARKEANKQSR